MTTQHTQYTTIYVVVAKVGARKAPFYGCGWQFHSVHESYSTALNSVLGWCRQGGKACAAVFSWSQVSGFELISLDGEEIGSHEAINASKIVAHMAVEQYHETMRNIAEQVTGREFPAGAVRSPLDVADAFVAAASDAAAETLAAALCYPVEADAAAAPPYKIGDRCPRCTSPSPELHPAFQYEGEVQPCSHPYHDRAK